MVCTYGVDYFHAPDNRPKWAEPESDDARDDRFRALNDRLWGPGRWIRCAWCPRDAEGREVYHHIEAHDGPSLPGD